MQQAVNDAAGDPVKLQVLALSRQVLVLHVAISLYCLLAQLEKAGVVHSDLKPANLMVDSKGRLVMIDFGMAAKLVGKRWECHMQGGTIEYASPEALCSMFSAHESGYDA